MTRILRYVRSYYHSLPLPLFIITSLLLSVLIGVNYIYSFNATVVSHDSFVVRILTFAGLYQFAFGGAYLLTFLMRPPPAAPPRSFYFLLIIAPLLFAAKVSLRVTDVIDVSLFGNLADYFRIVLQWPIKALVVIGGLGLIVVITREERPAFGLRRSKDGLVPYFGLLMLMLPLLLAAAATADFQHTYPRFQMVAGEGLVNALIFEICYAIDFFTIELFFRGFLVVAFIKYAGRDAILPMAVFYCTIHFGKPLAECISSYFGGLVLGAVVYETRSIWGGLVVHVGIAWMMEAIGLVI